MLCIKAYLDKFKDGIVLFYDTEFGAGWQYFDNMGISRERVIHTPIMDLEELKHDLVVQLKNIERGDHIIIFVDSIGNSASKKEAVDAEEGKEVADMTRAKSLKSLFRIVTPRLAMKDIPLVAVNHTYKTMEMFSKDVVGGGTGAYYSSQNIFIIGRQQDKDTKTKEILGYNFVINVEKSRFVQEKKKVLLNVTFEKGINTWSGLLLVAQEGGFVTCPKQGKYIRGDSKEQFTEQETNTKEFWEPVLLDTKFQEYIQKNFKLSNELVNSELTDEDVDDGYKEPKKKEDPIDVEELKKIKKSPKDSKKMEALKAKKRKKNA